jgi:GNAT superfamily N-acetyltransferase
MSMLAYPTTPFQLRRAEPCELSLVAELRLVSLLSLEMPRHSLHAIEALLNSLPGLDADMLESGRYFVAENAGDLLGGAGWSPLPAAFRSPRLGHEGGGPAFISLDADSVLLRGFFLDPDQGRRGVGAALLSQLEAEAALDGFRGAELIVAADAQLFYRSLGFRPLRRLTLTLDSGDTLPILQMRKPFAPRLAAAA